MKHFNQEQRRQAEFTMPPNTLKSKVGSGGLSDDVLSKAQKLLEDNTVDFIPLGDLYLEGLNDGINVCKTAGAADDNEYLISTMLYPSVQLKANGGMFHYPLISEIADKLIQFLEVIEEPDIEALEIIIAFHTTMNAVLRGKVAGDGGKHGEALLSALNSACLRYFGKHPDNNTE